MAERLVESADAERRLSESLQAAVRDYSQFAARVAEGDLTVTVSANGDQDLQLLSENLNSMVVGLADISQKVREGVQGIRTSTTEILAAVNQHTASASQQSAAINETSTTINEIRAASEQTADKAKEVAEQARSSVEVSDEGTRAVETIARSMEEIRERVEAIARDILTLSEQTQQIGEITATVNDLADQSNILALNASIEAAKAGEQGKGFAVVATEVRNLAEQSKGATAQVRRILGDIQQATTAAVLATEQGTKVVEEGLALSDRAGQGIRSLAETIREASHAAQQIAASAHEQSVGMDQIADAMRDVNDGTSQFVAGAQQSQQAAEDLNELSGNLAALTDRYRV
jgi:methyl-accepting chemotaxis protein